MLNKAQRKALFFPLIVAAGIAAGAAAAVTMFPVASVAGMAAIGVAGAAVGGVVLPVAGIGLFFGGKALKHFAQNDGAKIAVLGLLVGLAIAKALFVTPVQTVGKKIKSLFSKKKGQQPPSAVVHHAADTEASPLTDKTAQDGFNKAGQPAAEAKAEKPTPSFRANPPGPV